MSRAEEALKILQEKGGMKNESNEKLQMIARTGLKSKGF